MKVGQASKTVNLDTNWSPRDPSGRVVFVSGAEILNILSLIL